MGDDKVDSNLSKFALTKGNHIVTALTQNAVNNTMKEHLYTQSDTYTAYVLSTVGEKGESVYFYVEKNTDMTKLPDDFPTELKRQSLFSELEALGLFQTAAEKTEIFKNAYNNYYVENAFQFTTGLPGFFSLEEIKKFNPVDLIESTDPKKCGAVYTQCFREIVVIELGEKRGKFIVNIQKQSKQRVPWLIDYHVLFCYRGTEYDRLPKEIKEKLREHFENIPEHQIANLFEIRQLMMDLTTLSRASQPEIKNVNEKTQINIVGAFQRFIQNNLENALVNGYAILPSRKNGYAYMFKPKQYTFSVTKGPHIKDPGYKTLNYIMSTAGEAIVPQDYGWDWVLPSDPHAKSGVMAICRDIFFEKLDGDFKKDIIPKLRRHFIARMEGDGKTVFDMKYCYDMKEDKSADSGSFTFSAKDNQYHYPEYRYRSKSKHITVYVPPIFAATGQLSFDYKFYCTAKWGTMESGGVTYPAIIYEVEIILYTDIDYDSGHSTGNIYHHKLKCSLGISVNAYGKVSLLKSVTDQDLGKTLDISGWSQFASFGAINSMVKGITGDVENCILQVVNTMKNEFANSYLGYANWVMLGSKSFTFSNEEFSKYGDFCTNVKYVNPELEASLLSMNESDFQNHTERRN